MGFLMVRSGLINDGDDGSARPFGYLWYANWFGYGRATTSSDVVFGATRLAMSIDAVMPNEGSLLRAEGIPLRCLAW